MIYFLDVPHQLSQRVTGSLGGCFQLHERARALIGWTKTPITFLCTNL